MKLIAALLALSLVPVAAQAQTVPPEGVVWLALRDINALTFDADDPTNRPPLVTTPPEGMIQAVDVSDDGKPDWLIDYEAAAAAAFCGTGGCLKRLYVSTDDGYVRAFDTQALTLAVVEHQVRTTVHHGLCVPDNWDCKAVFRWDGAVGKLVAVPGGADHASPDQFVPVSPAE